MPFADGAKAQDEPTAILRRAGLVGVSDDARIEQGRRLERVFMKKIRTEQPALRLVQFGMRRERAFHLSGARLEDIEQIPVTTLEIFEHLVQLLCGGFGIELKDPIDDMACPNLVGWVEVAGFSRRFEGSDDDPGRVRAQIQNLTVQKSGLRQCGPLGLLEVRTGERSRLPIWKRVSFGPSQRYASTGVFLQDREDTIALIRRPCSHWVDPDRAHRNSGPYLDRSALSAGRSRPETNRTRAWLPPATR